MKTEMIECVTLIDKKDLEVPDLVQRMRSARNTPAVHKTALATLRSSNSDCFIFLCEGIDDKKVYFHWLRSINQSIDYEFQVCNGKKYLLEFRELLNRDTSGLSKNVYFFVDHDFDGLRGHPPGDDIYLSDFYSFENWLVTSDVLNHILCIDIHCHSEPGVRGQILKEFEKIYSSFLEITKPYNERIFIASQLGINIKPLPKSINKLADVSLVSVNPLKEELESIIKLEREPNPEEIEDCVRNFAEINPRNGYRGKFAMLFFQRWIDLLGKDRKSDNSIFFKDVEKLAANANCQLQLDSVAAKSLPPPLFRQFIERISRNPDIVELENRAVLI